MRLAILLLVVAIVLGGLVGTLVGRDPGYVMFAYGDVAVETSLWFAVLLLLATYVVIRIVVFTVARFAAGGSRFGAWTRKRRSRNARVQTTQGLLMMEEGQWRDALRLLTASAPRAAEPLINYLNAARAAHELGDEQQRDELLRLAHETSPRAELAIGLTQAKLQLDGQRWEPCLATLLELRSEAPKHPEVLDMLARVYLALGEGEGLIELLPALKKNKVYDPQRLTALQRDAWRICVESAGEDLPQVVKRAPRELKRDPEFVASLAAVALVQHQAELAETAVRSVLEKQWDSELIRLYGRIGSSEPGKQLAAVEGWLKARPDDANLLLTAGRVAMRNEQWAKAREYLESSLRLAASPEVYGELGRLCHAQGEIQRSNEYFAQALSMLPDLPQPRLGASA